MGLERRCGAATSAGSPEGGILPLAAQDVVGLRVLSHTGHLSDRPKDHGPPPHIPRGNRRRRAGAPARVGSPRRPGRPDAAVVRGVPGRPAGDVRARDRCGVLGAGQARGSELGRCVRACRCGVSGSQLVDRADERVIGVHEEHGERRYRDVHAGHDVHPRRHDPGDGEPSGPDLLRQDLRQDQRQPRRDRQGDDGAKRRRGIAVGGDEQPVRAREHLPDLHR